MAKLQLKSVRKKAQEISDIAKGVDIWVYRESDEYSVAVGSDNEPSSFIYRYNTGKCYVSQEHSFHFEQEEFLSLLSDIRKKAREATSTQDLLKAKDCLLRALDSEIVAS